MRTVIVGNRKLARHLLRHLLDNEWNIVGALVSKGKLATEQANYAPFNELVEDTNCEIHKTSDINAPETKEWLKEISPDVCLCGGWSQVIDTEILNIPEDGFIGFHSSKLPKGRGGAPVNWSLIRGAEEVWISMFYYTDELDTGDIITQGSVPVEPRDDVRTIFDALATRACELAVSAHNDLTRGDIDAKPQRHADATYRPRRQPQDGLITWTRDAEAIDDWIRGLTDPYPGAYTFYKNNKITVWEGEPIELAIEDTVPGEVIRIADGQGIDIQTGDGGFRVTRVQKGEEPPRWADRLARELEISPGDHFSREMAPEEWQYTGLKQFLEPASFDTNLEVGETGTLIPISFTGSRQNLSTRVTVGNETVFEESTTIANTYSERVEYSFAEPGVYTISADFEIDGLHVDTRYLKVYVHD